MHLNKEERFRGSFEQAPFGICLRARDGRLIEVNAAFCQMLGYSEQELLEISFTDLLHEDERQASDLRKDQLWAGQIGFVDAITRFIHRTGTAVWAHIRVSLVRDTDGSGLYAALHVEDITKIQRTLEALRESEDRFRVMADGCPTILWVTDAVGENRFVNRAYREFSGAGYEELKGREWELFLHPDDAGGYVDAFRLAIQHHASFRAEVRIMRADGQWRWLDSRGEPRFSDAGEFLGHVGISSDFTDRRRAEMELAASQELAQATIDALSSQVCVLDESGTIIAINRASIEFADAKPVSRTDQISRQTPGLEFWSIGANYLRICDDAIGPDAIGSVDIALGIRSVLRAKCQTFSVEYPCHTPSEKRWFIARATRFFIAQNPKVLVEHIDITDRKLAEQVVQSSEEKFRQLAENIRDVYWMMNGTGSELLYVSPAYENIWGLTRASLCENPKSWMNAIHPGDRACAAALIFRRLQGEMVECEYRIVQPSGTIRWIRDRAFAIRDESGKIVRLTGVAEDNTERKLAELRLVHQARYDELTGLPNRRLFQEKLVRALAECPCGKSGTVFFIDLDRFKLVNDTFGHAAGDALLIQVVRRLLAVCGEYGTLARFGGDEFTFLATGLDGAAEARVLGNRLIRCLDEPFLIANRELFIGACIGISLFPENGTEPDILKRYADMAMHHAKRAGKNQLMFFAAEFCDTDRELLGLETRLRRAIALDEFRLQFQPQFAAGRANPTRFEALIRWYPSDSDPIPPLRFIPAAEQSGLIVPIGTWVLREACRRCAAWQSGSLAGAGVAVNVSALQFASPDFVEIVMATLESAGLASHLLELEVTESAFIRDMTASALVLTKLRKIGVTVALDDFGTGYSSLSYLQDLPLDALKIDRSFVLENNRRPHRTAVLRCIVELAHELGLRVVGEGVETKDQLELLESLGCDDIQGYLFGKPEFIPLDGDSGKRWSTPHLSFNSAKRDLRQRIA